MRPFKPTVLVKPEVNANDMETFRKTLSKLKSELLFNNGLYNLAEI